jgi:polyhydroxybutyrate depolymerase
MIRFARLLAAVLTALLVLGACSDDGEDAATEDVEADDTAADDGDTDDPGTTTTVVTAGEPVASAGCGASDTGAVLQERRELGPDAEGTDRWYLLTTPEEHDGETPLPVVIDYHGILEGAELHSTISGIAELAQAEGFVGVIPNGSGSPVRWDITTDETNVDVAFTNELLDTLQAELCVDTSRIYAIGLSNGALFSSVLACQLDDRIAAFSMVSGISDPDPCEPGRPVPVVAFHGTADPILRFNATALPDIDPDSTAPATTTPPADLNGDGYPANVAAWAERNGCEPEPADTDVTERVIHRVYECPSAGPVEFYILEGGGHDWPGNELTGLEQGIDPSNPVLDIDASELSWEFFQRFSLPS